MDLSPWFLLALPYLRNALMLATALCAVAVSASLAYCLFLLAVAALARRRTSPMRERRDHTTRFCILVPAHDEELILSSTLDALMRLDYPIPLRQIVVIADNCTDKTARIAAEYPGVRVLERTNPRERGKGYALNWAHAQELTRSDVDAYVVVDADTQVDPQFLNAMDAAYCAHVNASGHFAAQGRYDVLNEDEGWRTALMAGALALAHGVRPLARERLGLTVGLKGNGMCFSATTLRAVAWSASLTEDIDFAMDLIERLDLPVHYVPDANVSAQMPATAQASRSQRDRWERGRFEILRRRGWKMLFSGLLRGSALRLDAALDLIVPPLAEMAAGLAVWGVFLGCAELLGGGGTAWVLWWITAAALLPVYVLVGFSVGGAPKTAYSALLLAPGYIVWKLALRLLPKRGKGGGGGTGGIGGDAWIRTERAAIAPSAEIRPSPEGAE